MNLHKFLDPCFKFDYIKDILYNSTVALIVQHEVLVLIQNESKEIEAQEEHGDPQNEVAEAAKPSQPPRKNNGLQKYFINPVHHKNFRSRRKYIHFPCPEVDGNPHRVVENTSCRSFGLSSKEILMQSCHKYGF